MHIFNALKSSSRWDKFFLALLVFNSVISFVQGDITEGFLWFLIGVYALLIIWKQQTYDSLWESYSSMVDSNRDLIMLNRTLLTELEKKDN